MPRQASSHVRRIPDGLGQRDRRADRRYQSSSTSALATVVHGGQRWGARVCNVSCDGISLQVPEPLPVGTVVTVEMGTKSGLFARTLEVRVLHARTLLDGCHVLGGCFTSGRLAPEDLAALLTQTQIR
jgi:PilZ domain